MPKILAVFMDGTWNEPNDATNVYTLYSLAHESAAQKTRYVPGVGTKGKGLWQACDKLMGGAFGVGLSANIVEGYRWLCEQYQLGDQVFLFGFSRGAYTARSLGGMIGKAGLVKDPTDETVQLAYGIYRDKDCARHNPGVVEFRQRYAWDVPVDFVGVWDTVGALGIPVQGLDIPGFSSFYSFHDTNLSEQVRAGYHAIAANEYRSLYAPTLWTAGSSPRSTALPVEQRWFVGAHCDVGGGYDDGILQCKPAAWVQQKAAAHGMQFASVIDCDPAYSGTAPHDSYGQFKTKFPLSPVQMLPRSFSAPPALNMTTDSDLRQRLQNGFLNQLPSLRDALLKLPEGGP